MPLSLLILLGIFAVFLILRSRAPGSPRSAATDPDAATFEALRRSGADLSRPHLVEFFLYFEREPQARAAAETLTAEGYSAEVSQEPEDDHWLCLAKQELVPDLSRLTAMGARLTAVAEAHGGGYDGWGVEVDDGKH